MPLVLLNNRTSFCSIWWFKWDRLETTGYGVSVYGTVAIGSSIYDSNGNLGSDGQVLSSVPGIGVSWTDQTGGSGVLVVVLVVENL